MIMQIPLSLKTMAIFKVPAGPLRTLMAKIEKKINDKGKAIVSLTQTWEIDKAKWAEFKEHLKNCIEDDGIIVHYDWWSLSHHMQACGDPTKVTYRITAPVEKKEP